MKNRSSLFCALALLGVAVALPAHARDDRIYIAPSAYYSVADRDRLTDDGFGGQLSIGKRLARGLNLELTGFFTVYDPDNAPAGASDTTFKGIGLGAMVFPFSRWENLYAVLAVYEGFTDDAPCEPPPGFDGCRNNYKSTVFDSGVGYLWSLGDLLGGAALRAEARYRMDSHSSRFVGSARDHSEHYDGVFSLGLLIPLGRYVEAEPDPPVREDVRVVRAECPEHPDVPPGVAVDVRGCPLDSDGDGVPDYLDRCPDTPPGTPVDEFGCPLPTAECRPPFPGEAVDERGCATGDVVVLSGVTFEFDSERLSANAKVILDGVADTLLAVRDLRVEIGGHTDSIGTATYNQRLSERRARAVKDYLVERGVGAGRMETRGYGEEQPVESNQTEEGRELNRRVELRILGDN